MPPATDCIFCRIVAGEMGKKIHEDNLVAAFEDVHPQAPHHTLVVPKEHLASPGDLTPGREELAGRLLTTAVTLAARKGLDRKGYRMVINCGESAGQSVFHLHLHLLGGRSFGWPPG
ncbi:MAG: histidine triad nucleotide-binding protein [Acidobacteriota bacterium]